LLWQNGQNVLGYQNASPQAVQRGTSKTSFFVASQ
jgi:hypothetical protein